MISSIREFQTIVDRLSHYGFYKVNAPWTLYHEKYNVVVDLLPFGEIEQNFTIHFNERHIDLHVLGLNEVLEFPESVFIEEKLVEIPSLQGMVILKLIAWSDRPEDRDTDLFDILRIIEYYFEFNFDEIVEYHNDIFPEDDYFDQLRISARVLGRKASGFLKASSAIKTKILTTLSSNIVDPKNSIIAKQWSTKSGWNIEYSVEILDEFKMGLTE